MTYGAHNHPLLLAFLLVFVLNVNGLSPTYNLRRGRHVRARLDSASNLIDAEAPDESYDPDEDETPAALGPILAGKRSISLQSLFFPGADAAQQEKHANEISNGKVHINNNLLHLSAETEKEEVGSNGKSKIAEDEINKRHNKHSADDKHKGPKIWDQWGKWSSCSVTCGIGKITRWRHCVSGGCSAGEKEAQIKTCTMPAC